MTGNRHIFGQLFWIVLFLFNSAFTGDRFTITLLLTPFLLWMNIKNYGVKWLFVFFGIVGLHLTLTYAQLISPIDYIKSTMVLFGQVNLALVVFAELKTNPSSFERAFPWILSIALLMAIVAVLGFNIELIHPLFWYDKSISSGIQFPRLKLLNYEPSFLSMWLFLFWVWSLYGRMKSRNQRYVLGLITTSILLVMSFSMGAIAIGGASVMIALFLYWHTFQTWANSKSMLRYGLILGAAFLVVLFVFPNNPFTHRIINIFEGGDTSVKGRTIESFMLAKRALIENKAFWGLGLGQIKYVAKDLIVNYYQYTGEIAQTVRIPNSAAECLATFGPVGLLLKIGTELYLAKRLKVYKNVFSMTLFLFIFCYQFAGSYLTSYLEFTLFAIAFASPLNQFDCNESVDGK